MNRLNPYHKTQAAALEKAKQERNKKRAARIKESRSKAGRKAKINRNKGYQQLQDELKQSFADAQKILDDEEIAGNYVPGDTTEEEDE